MELEIKGKGLSELALETPDFVRAKNATDIASQVCVYDSFIHMCCLSLKEKISVCLFECKSLLRYDECI